MTVLAALLVCLLFHTATLEEHPATEGTQHQTPQHGFTPVRPEPSQSPEPVPNPETTGTSAVVGEKTDLKKKTNSTQAESDIGTKKTPIPTTISTTIPTTKPQTPKEPAEGPAQCQMYTRWSCSKVFCPPWRRCISGQCVCKMPYKCPRQVKQACTLDGSHYYSMCQAKAISCRSSEPVFSHFSSACRGEDTVEVHLRKSKTDNVVMIKTAKGTMPVCGNGWNMASANVVCRNPLKEARGAETAAKAKLSDLDEASDWPEECMRVRCTGSELSLAECTLYNPQAITESSEVAVANCYKPKDVGECKTFLCTNGKCLIQGKACNGIDDCGDYSDEMCCQRCNGNKAFHCKSDICIPLDAVRDGVRDCLGGEDELDENPKPVEIKPQNLFSNPMSGENKLL